MPDPLVSVVIPTYRRPHLIGRTLRSVLRQTYAVLEVLVVIDGIDDGTSAVVEALGDPRIRVIEMKVNQGPAAARNMGVQNATGEYIALLDDDDEWSLDKLERQIRFVQEQHLVGQDFLLSCRVVSSQAVNRVSQTWPRRVYRAGQDVSEFLFDRVPLRPTGITSGSLLFPRSLAARVPFPNDGVMEDAGWLLLCAVGERAPLIMLEEALFIYHIDPAGLSRNNKVDWHLGLEWGRRYRSYLSGRAFAGLLASSIAWRAKRQDGGYRAYSQIARAMRTEAQPTFLHWMMLAGIIVLPTNFAAALRRRV